MLVLTVPTAVAIVLLESTVTQAFLPIVNPVVLARLRTIIQEQVSASLANQGISMGKLVSLRVLTQTISAKQENTPPKLVLHFVPCAQPVVHQPRLVVHPSMIVQIASRGNTARPVMY